MAYSYSKINLHRQCPRAYWCRYVDRRQEIRSEALVLGSEVHAWIAEYNRHLIEKGLQTDLSFISNIGASGEAKEILEVFADAHILEPGDYLVEQRWEDIAISSETPPTNHLFTTVIDLLKIEGDREIIRDYKSDHKIRSQADIEKDLQLRCYAVAADTRLRERDLGASEYVCIMDFVRHGVTREVVYAAEDIPELREEILTAIDRIEGDSEYEPTPGTYCAWCSWTADCPAIKDGGLEVLTGPEDALELAAEKIALEARKKVVDELLKPWCTQEGAIERNGMETGYFKEGGVKYPDNTALQVVLAKRDLEFNEHVRADIAKLKKAAKDDKALADALAEIAVDASTTKFRSRKVKT